MRGGASGVLMKTVVVSACIVAALAFPGLAGAQDAKKGEALFKQRCSVCHSVVLPPKPGPGPNLHGVVGRKAALAAPFKYSAALQKSGLTWTPANLDKFLTAPAQTVPGTFMVIALPNAPERRDVLAYLATV